jgi:hypothetical protein
MFGAGVGTRIAPYGVSAVIISSDAGPLVAKKEPVPAIG